MKYSYKLSNHLKYKRFFIFIILSIILITVLTYSPIGAYLRIKISRTIEFKVREYLNKAPVLSSNIKILAIDDSTVSLLNSPALSYQQWAKLLKYLDLHRPKMIIINKVFSISEGFDNELKKIQILKKALKKIQTPVVVGVMLLPHEIKYRQPLNLQDFWYFKTNYIKNFKKQFNQIKPKFTNTNKYVYGPLEPLSRAFSYLGHINYNADGKVLPIALINEDYFVPHISLFAAKNLRFDHQYFYINDKIVPLFADGTIPVNFSSYKTYLQNTKSLQNIIKNMHKGVLTSYLKQGDYIFIIPYFYSGNTNFKETPLGMWPDAYVHIAMLNSILTDNWLKPIEMYWLIIVLSIIGGSLIGLLSYSWFIVGNILAITLFFVLGMIGFSYYNIIIPWFISIVSFLVASNILFIIKARYWNQKLLLLRNVFKGEVSEKTLSGVLKKVSDIDLEAKERVVSVMFIDIVGYSLLVENRSPKFVFDQLKQVISNITEIIYSYGGIVNKILGDGILSFFGYSFEDDQMYSNHLVNAFVSAVKIQQMNLKEHLLLLKNNKIFYPLRIGIHTSSVYLGNLGIKNHIEYALLGNGVNFAKRLENACNLYSIMISSTAWNIIKSSGLNLEGFKKKPIQIKHHDEMIEAYEYDPFYDCIDLKKQAIDFYRKYINSLRVDQRYVVWSNGAIYISSDYGDGLLLNYSVIGLNIKLFCEVLSNSKIVLQIKSKDGILQRLLAKHNIDKIEAKVRWGYKELNSYIYGLIIENLTSKQGEVFVKILQEFDIEVASSKSRLSKKIA